MLLINGALAAWNGVLAATGKFWCECVRGGTCCGGECRCDEGECCGDEWYTDPGECCSEQWIDEGGAVAGLEGEWVCCDDSNGAVTFRILAPADPGCEGLIGRCCTDGNCTEVPAEECAGELLPGSCDRFGCPKSCCEEDAAGLVACEQIDELLCAGTVDEEPCETACKGACCVDGELVEGSPLTQAACDDLSGCWQGIGTTECSYQEEQCRAPFDEDCCESVVSSAARLTFTGPRKRRCPEFNACGFQVTVTVTTGHPVYIHGGLFGAPYEACTDITTFLLCNDEFHVTPALCSGNLDNLDIEVCWADASGGPETLRFHCCQNTTYLLGNCECDCVTTLLYEGGGCTTNAALEMRGDAIIDASGTGALVLTSAITAPGSCVEKLTLTGTSTAENQIGVIQNSSSGLKVDKTGSGLWRLAGASAYSGRLRVLDGTLVIAASVGASGASPFGTQTASNKLPIIGGGAGPALLLADGGVDPTIDRGFYVAAGPEVTIGVTGFGTAIFGGGNDVTLGRGVTLQASTGSEVTFANNWVNEAGPVAFTIGSAGNDGVVVLESELPESTGVSIVNGTARLQVTTDDRIAAATPVTFGTATFDRNGQNQTTNGMTVTGTATFIGTGTYTIATTLAGSGSIVHSDGTLAINGTNTMSGSVSILSGSVVVGQIVSGPAGKVTSATFTNTTLTVAFSSDPTAGDQYKLLAGSTVQTYTPVLAGTAMTGTYNSATSTLTIA